MENMIILILECVCVDGKEYGDIDSILVRVIITKAYVDGVSACIYL